MSLKIRLTRVGAKKQASYRIVVADSAAPRDGKAIAILGHYNPLTDPYTLKVDAERAVDWLKKGAQPSETARGLLTKAGVITAFEAVRKGSAAPVRVTAEEAKARRAARAKRTEAPRLVRPNRPEGAAATEDAAPARKAAPAAKTTRAKSGTKAAAAKSTASKTAAAKPAATTTRRRTKKDE
ncbi:MAG: 30S ribosomal protein S16 [Chloroflexi bacterium]|nr:30S ribosomal protein S16 [Chloroflexota bacterium]